MNANMNTSYQFITNYEGSVSRRRNHTQASHPTVRTSGDVKQKEITASKDEVLISRATPDGAEDRAQAAENQTADFQAEQKPKLQLKSGILSSSDKTFIQLAGQYRDLTKDRSTWPSIKELELLTNRTVRQETEQTVEDLLRENGIRIPEGQSLRLTVDSCDYYIRVEGLEDQTLAESIEKVLNQGQNGFNLFTHIQRCAPSKFGYDNPSQYNSETAEKSVLYHLVKEMTGYDLRELQNEDGKFYTPDGSDLWLELKEKAEAYSPFQLEKYQEVYEKMAKTGWEGSPDHSLSLEYIDGHLLDIDTEYGYGPGQTDWQEELLPKLPEEAECEEAETIRQENTSQEETEAKSTGAVSQDEKVTGKAADPNLAFPKFNPALKYAKYLKVLDEYYEKQNEENLRFANPAEHIRDKYYNQKSPYYIRGLSPLEREIGMEQEMGMLCGRQPSLNNYDPVIQRTFGGCNSFTADQEYNQEMRGQINDCINQIFSANGIVIPDGTELYLTVDPYDYRIHAEGVGKELAAAIESALNYGQNGYSLYNHISYCNQGNMGLTESGQYAQGDTAKAAVYHMVRQLTGYDLRSLENKNGRFYTPDGNDLWEVLSNRYKEMAESGEAGSFRLEDYYDHYRRIAKEGWSRGIDAVLTIGYKNGLLFDAAV